MHTLKTLTPIPFTHTHSLTPPTPKSKKSKQSHPNTHSTNLLHTQDHHPSSPVCVASLSTLAFALAFLFSLLLLLPALFTTTCPVVCPTLPASSPATAIFCVSVSSSHTTAFERPGGALDMIMYLYACRYECEWDYSIQISSLFFYFLIGQEKASPRFCIARWHMRDVDQHCQVARAINPVCSPALAFPPAHATNDFVTRYSVNI